MTQGQLPRFYEAIINKAMKTVLRTRLARAIFRKGGWLSGGTLTVDEEDAPAFFPPGGRPGDVAIMTLLDPTFNPGTRRWSWITPNYLTAARIQKAKRDRTDWALGKAWHAGTHSRNVYGYRFGPPGGVPDTPQNHPGAPQRDTDWADPLGSGNLEESENQPGGFDGNMPVPVYTLALRNPQFPNSGASVSNLDADVRVGQTAPELLVWESVPEGTWLYPFNVPWFITRRDLTPRRGQYYPRQVCIRTTVVEGSPQADLAFRFAQTAAGPWTDMVGVDLAGGPGPKTSAWIALPNDAAQDVWVSLAVVARSSITKLHLGPVEVLARWAPRNHRIPQLVEEFGNEFQKLGGTPTLSFSMEPPGRLTPGPPGSAFYWLDWKAHDTQLAYDVDTAKNIAGGWGTSGYAAPGWLAARIIPRENPANPRIIFQLVPSLSQRCVFTDQGDGTVLMQIRASSDEDLNTVSPYLAHYVARAMFGAELGGTGIMRDNFEAFMITSPQSIFETLAPNTDDVRSVYDWLWGDTANPVLP